MACGLRGTGSDEAQDQYVWPVDCEALAVTRHKTATNVVCGLRATGSDQAQDTYMWSVDYEALAVTGHKTGTCGRQEGRLSELFCAVLCTESCAQS